MESQIRLVKKIERIAVVRLSAMGDCILLQPILLRILEYWPEVEIDWYIDKTWAPLFQDTDRLNLIAIDKPRRLRDYRKLKQQYFQQEYDVLLAVQASFRANLLYAAIRAPLKIGFDRARARDGQHFWTNHRIAAAQDHLRDGFGRFADLLGVPKSPMIKERIQLAPKATLPAEFLRLGDTVPLIGILPAASKLERSPYPEFWINLINRIDQQCEKLGGRMVPKIVLLGGPSISERKLSAEILAGIDNPIESIVGKTNLPQLACAINALSCLIGPDSGPLHLANALQTPVIGLYAVAPGALSAPYRYKALTFDCYEEAVRRFLKKDPKTVPWGTRVHDRRAMKLFDPKAVSQRVMQVLAQG